MPPRIEPAWTLPIPELAELLTLGYRGYVVPLSFTAESVTRVLRVNGIDLDTSRVAILNGHPVGIALLAHRGWTTRLAALGVAPEARGTGVGRALLAHVLAEGRRRGDRAFTLEVLEANAPAVRLYESMGFSERRRLVGYRCDDPEGDAKLAGAVLGVDVRDLARLVLLDEPADFPWQLSGETIAQLGPPVEGHRLGDAFAAVQRHAAHVELMSLFVPPAGRRRGEATRLIRALFSVHRGLSWRIPARVPEEVPSGLFAGLGFVREQLRQRHLFLALDDGTGRVVPSADDSRRLRG